MNKALRRVAPASRVALDCGAVGAFAASGQVRAPEETPVGRVLRSGSPDHGREMILEPAGGEPDLVIMDVRLAGPRDGVDGAIDIYRRFGVRSMFASANSDRKTAARAREANPLGWVAKPYSPAGLVAEIRSHFGD